MACIPYKGKLEVEGIGAGATSTEVTGAGAGMFYCPGDPYGPSAQLPNPDGTGTFRVKVKPTTQGECSSQLVGHYGVRFWSGSASELGTSSDDFRCFSWNTGSVRVGDLVVHPTGHGEGVYSITAGAQPGYGAVCVQNPRSG